MKIYLFLNNKLLHFLLPKDALGSFSFDEFENEESKLINVEGKNNKWYMYSTSEVKIYENGTLVKNILLEAGKFYLLRRNNIDYLIYCCDATKCNVNIYKHNKNFNLIIGTGNNCNLRFKHSFKSDIIARIYFEKGTCFLEKKVPYIYQNNIMINSDNYKIKYGDEIEIYYLKVIVLADLLLVFSDEKVTFQNMLITNLKEYSTTLDKPIEIEIKDENLYTKSDYYYKSPRLRRFIKTKEIKFSKPPIGNPDEDLPAILTIGPIFTMGTLSFVNLSSTISNMLSGETTISTEWPKLLTAIAMLLSMIMWPLIIKWYSKRLKLKKRKKLEEKYGNYLLERRKELLLEANYQSSVLHENLLSTIECFNIILKKGYNFWDRRRDQDDFLQVRLGLGFQKLDVNVKYSEEDFTVDEDNLKKQADKVVDEFKYIYNVPLKYSFYDNKITAIIGNSYKCHSFMNNLILQLITFYTYEDLKFVVFTNKQNEANWQYLKYLNHSFSNSKNIRFFSSNIEDAKNVSEYLHHIANQRIQNNSIKSNIPHFIVVIDDYNMVKSLDFIKLITETESDIGFSIVLLQDRLSELPSRCNNFISIGQNGKCELIRNSVENQEYLQFNEEIVYDLDMMKVARQVFNIPIEFENGIESLPDSISFLGMEKIGKIEQLNILNRWKTNDATMSLKSEIGVDESGNLIYLDLHEKAHGPHGLIAGTTGSGKSEFIITYILSLCINFSPDIVSFVLIDYKGGGLALAFENKNLGLVLPHLAGTITNLDKAEMDRTLVSIDSEIKRRQKLFNEARENLGESTIDIYKYQRYYKAGKLKEPIPHLFIICDEFAELKSQQTEFMDNLISVARIGRSLGVHLILATQKPSGVVNDQIWSNSKFKVCLKVQDENDSKEIIKKTDAAYLKQAGRFYLQVGYDELYVLGQSAWCGAKYFPSDKMVKEVDKSLNFINDSGKFIKSIKAANKKKSVAEGEQFSAILNLIIEISNKIGKKSKKLWLDNIEPIILVDELKNKYSIKTTPYNVECILGEYDAPEIQYQGIVKYNFLNDGNTIIYGNNGTENEMLLNTIIYSTCKNHSSSEINFYILDYGSESLRKYESLSHVGGIVYASDEEKYNNLIKLIKNEIKYRKKLFANYGGDYKNYIKTNKLPLLAIILNNYDSISEINKTFFEIIPDLIRDSERYGIVFIITCNTITSINSKISSNCPNVYAFKLKDQSDYMSVFGIKVNNSLKDITGRGFVKNDKVHEFQTASIIKDENLYSEFIINFIKSTNELNPIKAPSIPILPEQVKYENISEKVTNLNNVPVGISKEDLSVVTIDYLNDVGNIISSNRLNNIDKFIKSLIMTFKSIKNLETFVIDPLYKLNLNRNYVSNYFVEDMDGTIEKFNKYLDKLIEEKHTLNGVIIIYGIDKFISKLKNTQDFQSMLQKLKTYEKISIIIADDSMKIRNYLFESWFKLLFNINNGIWVGKGIADQNLFHLTTITKEMTKEIENNMGYIISESTPTLCKILDFLEKEEGN